MKTIEELKEMGFIPHHSCGICNEMVGWHNNGEHAWFDSGCGCCDGGGHYASWEEVHEKYNAMNGGKVST